MTNIIFLDIDGVLNKVGSSLNISNDGIKTPHIDSFAVGLVNLLVSDVEAQLVLSSDWRKFDSSLEMKTGSFDVRRFLVSKGLKNRFHADWHTPISHHYHGHRGAEINDWLVHHHDIKQWVALDDNPDFSIKHLVLVNPNNGLQVADVKKAESFFNIHPEDTE